MTNRLLRITAALCLVATLLTCLADGATARAQNVSEWELPARLLDGYARGETIGFPDSTTPDSLYNALRRANSTWVAQAPEADRQRRRNVLALIVLERANDKLAYPSQAVASRIFSEASLVEWACDLLRNGEPTAFEHDWMKASILIARKWRQEEFPLGPRPGRFGCTGNKPPCFQVRHARSRFPDDPWFKAAEVFSRADVNVLTRRPIPFEDVVAPAFLGSMPMYRSQPFDPGSTALTAAQEWNARSFELLEELGRDPTFGSEARLHLGLLAFETGDIPRSRNVLTTLVASKPEPFLEYFARLVIGLGYDTQHRDAEATTAFESAVAIDPGLSSGATTLALHYFLQDRRDEADAVLNRALRQPSAKPDPWKWPCANCRELPALWTSLHQSVRLP